MIKREYLDYSGGTIIIIIIIIGKLCTIATAYTIFSTSKDNSGNQLRPPTDNKSLFQIPTCLRQLESILAVTISCYYSSLYPITLTTSKPQMPI
jgi:hypothetical protein